VSEVSTLIPKGFDTVLCKNERERSTRGGEVTVSALYNSSLAQVVFVIEDHVTNKISRTPALEIRAVEVLNNVIKDVLWKANIS